MKGDQFAGCRVLSLRRIVRNFEDYRLIWMIRRRPNCRLGLDSVVLTGLKFDIRYYVRQASINGAELTTSSQLSGRISPIDQKFQ